MTNKIRSQYMLSGERFENFIFAAQKVCKAKERFECRKFIKAQLLNKLHGKSMSHEMVFGLYYVLLILQKLMLEKMIYGHHMTENEPTEIAEQILMQWIFISPGEKTDEIFSSNVKMYYEELDRAYPSARYKSLIANLNEIVSFTRLLLDDLEP